MSGETYELTHEWCEAKIAEVRRLREALENIKKHFETISPRGFHRQSVAWVIADKALQRGEVGNA